MFDNCITNKGSTWRIINLANYLLVHATTYI